MKIEGENYLVEYDKAVAKATFQGALRLNGMHEYAPIVQLLDQTIDQAPSVVTLDLQRLQFLNSSGINVLSKFVIKVRQKEQIQMVVIGSQTTPWQKKSLRNLQRLMPSLELVWE